MTLQAKVSPIVGFSDEEFKTNWTQYVKAFENELLTRQIDFATIERDKTQRLLDAAEADMVRQMADDPDALQEAQAAVKACSDRVRAQEYTKHNKRYTTASNRKDDRDFVGKTSKKDRPPRKQNTKKPNKGPGPNKGKGKGKDNRNRKDDRRPRGNRQGNRNNNQKDRNNNDRLRSEEKRELLKILSKW